MLVPYPAFSWGPETRNSLAFLVSRYVREYASYLDALRFTDMSACSHLLKSRDRHKGLHDIDVAAWVKSWMPCAERAIFVSCCVGSEADCPLISCYKEAEFEEDL